MHLPILFKIEEKKNHFHIVQVTGNSLTQAKS